MSRPTVTHGRLIWVSARYEDGILVPVQGTYVRTAPKDTHGRGARKRAERAAMKGTKS